MEKLRWGVLSTAKIGLRKVIPAMQRGQYCSIDAIASRDFTRAKQAADALGIPRAYGSYEELLADEAIDAIYNPLPNHLHVPWSLKALAAGEACALREAGRHVGRRGAAVARRGARGRDFW